MLGRVGLYTTNISCIARQQVEASQPPDYTRKAVWKPHCGAERPDRL